MPEITAVLWQLHVLLLWIQLGCPLICLIIRECFGENILFSEVLQYLCISTEHMQVCKWPSILPGKVFAHNGSCFSGTASDPGRKGWEVWRVKNTACVAWMSHGRVRNIGDLG